MVPPAGLIGGNHGFRREQFQPPLDHRMDEVAGPRNVPQRSRATPLPPEHLVEQRGGLAQRDPQMRPAIAPQQPGARPDVGLGDPGRCGRLRNFRTARATRSMPPITRDFHTRRRKVCHRVFVELARVFERPTAIETDVVPQIVNEVSGAGFDRRSHPTGRLSLPLRPPILVPLRP